MHILYIYLYTVYAHKIITYIVLEFFIQTEVQGSDYMIKIEHLTKQFDNFKFALSDISFSIPKGYICGLIGENGAGKSTLIHTILGLYRADRGDIYINGHDIAIDEIATKNDIGYVLSDELFDPYMTLINNADSYGKYYINYNRNLFIEYCKRFELNIKSKLQSLSKGEKLKFQFAFALAHSPKLLLLDEPTANFDPRFRNEFFEILTNFISDGEHSILLATHLTSDLEIIADYITFIHKGQLLLSTDRETLLNSYRLIQGEAYKLNSIKKSNLIHSDIKDKHMVALVKHHSYDTYDKELTVSIPTIEDIMYHYIKEDSHV